ncbi:hypothetical protein PVAP13_3NG180348 [Panicum virgatum]|uniref:Uncharacterized protein n=1 Tax=Panicum virgatum TaxID=38727 RepID=A0A8T0U8L6_PANVG|nr:hypothetical protein PVAP13_3NG180348 [Panicum virgatum]
MALEAAAVRFWRAAATAKPIPLPAAPLRRRGGGCCWNTRPVPLAAARLRVSAASSDVPDFLSSNWLETLKRKPFGPRLNFSAEEAVEYQLESLKYNDQPRQDYGIEVMYRFAGFDPFERSTYFGRHHTYRVLLGHKERKILSSLWVEENQFKQRVWVQGACPEEEGIFQFTMVQRVGGSLINDGDAFSGGIAY